MKPIRFASLFLLFALAIAQTWDTRVTPDRRAVLDHISANSLKGNLSFLSSDLLEGRGTPSRGLDLAAEFIASRFRESGLEPAGDDGFFQTATVKGRPAGAEPSAELQDIRVRNVVGLLRGSDPALKDTYIIVSGHYDHLGISNRLEGDKIFNGANDDGSGTVSVIELATALSKLKVKPKRSIVFMTFYGEERGLLGSRYYGSHPVFPIDKTVAAINLEHMGRTDDTEGTRLNEMVMTGFDYSEVGAVFAKAASAVGSKVSKHPKNSDAFFGRSDNQALADLGIPSHSLCTTFIFPDYHQVGDTWDKVDYDNLSKVLRAVALGLMTLGDSPAEPKWNADNPKAKRYLDAWVKLKGG